MADAISVTVRDNAGAPVTTGVSVLRYIDRSGVVRPVVPAAAHVGDGKWVVRPSDADEAAGTILVLDCGAGRFVSAAIHKADQSNQFWVFVFQDTSGAAWAGSGATGPQQYVDPAGAARTPPALQPAEAPWIYTLTPTGPDVAAGVEGRLDAPAGAIPLYWEFSSESLVATSTPAPIPVTLPPDACAQQVGDLADVVEALASGCYVVTRSAATPRVNGRRMAPVTVSFEIIASVQPASGREMDRLPEGLRSRETMNVFTRTELRSAHPSPGTEADRIAIDGAVFEVTSVRRWNRLANFYNATVVRVLE
jgi:hypothetical protein